MKPKNPTLAVTAPSLEEIDYPVALQPKIDGACALGGGDGFYSRRIKLFPNKAVQAKFKEALRIYPRLEGLHGECITESVVDGQTIMSPRVDKDDSGMTLANRTSSVLMTIDGHDRIEWWAFDHQDVGDNLYELRHAYIVGLKERGELPDWVKIVPLAVVHDAESAEIVVGDNLTDGYEGTVAKSLREPYKTGRATQRKGELMRITVCKRDEAIITDAHEELANDNEAKVGTDGRTARSSHRENLRPTGTLGALSLRGLDTGPESMWVDVDFRCGTGFDDAEKARLWALHKEGKLVGQIVTYEHKPHGAKDAPRFPAYKMIRAGVDV